MVIKPSKCALIVERHLPVITVKFLNIHEGLLPPLANSAPSWRSKQLETFYLIFSQYPILSSCQLFSDEKVFIGTLICGLIL